MMQVLSERAVEYLWKDAFISKQTKVLQEDKSVKLPSYYKAFSCNALSLPFKKERPETPFTYLFFVSFGTLQPKKIGYQ